MHPVPMISAMQWMQDVDALILEQADTIVNVIEVVLTPAAELKG